MNKPKPGDTVLIRHPAIGSRWMCVIELEPDRVHLKDIIDNPDNGGWNFPLSCIAKAEGQNEMV